MRIIKPFYFDKGRAYKPQVCAMRKNDGRKMMYETCIFDLYGTLVDIRTDEEKEELWERLAFFMHITAPGILLTSFAAPTKG